MTHARYPKSSCSVPFCPRTTTTMPHEWLCAEHWRLVDRGLRQIRSRLVRRWKREGRFDRRECWPRINRALDGWWRRAKAQAIERAAGASA